jgi:lipid-A-disaccharide synthase
VSQLSIMLIAGEPSGDLIAGELITALRAEPRMRAREFAPRFFGAGGPNMAAAGVELDFDMSRHAVVGLWEVLKRIAHFRRLLNRLVELALTRRPNVIVCVDFGGFNLRLARALRTRLRDEGGVFHNWRPRLVQYVSPQVWASRPGRAYSMADTLDLLLCILPYEKSWYARHVPKLRVEFVGHPILERHSSPQAVAATEGDPIVALLPGSRRGELRAHVPVMLAAARQMLRMTPARFEMVRPLSDRWLA